ncbi:trypsin-like peptidase domain-containing protein [Streptomyces sp. NPDC102467]|uniref:VMAP-C domain-containing protein n=1 Tax=Streptomyces sp. NPDC102467 TaxID=3366179 RepID=UPI003814AED7
MIQEGSHLDSLAQAATVHLLPDGMDGPGLWGSGFFVAPGLVLTAAHVLRPHLNGRTDTVFGVRGSKVNDDIPLRARLLGWLLRDSAEPAVPADEDLALVRLLDADVEHECVWLSERAVRHTGPLRVHGYRMEEGRAGRRVVPWSVNAETNVLDGTNGLRFRPDADFPNGVSGGPLLDAESGAVVGVVKSRRLERDGGAAVSTLALRGFGAHYRDLVVAHDQWHGKRHRTRGRGDRWIDLQTKELDAEAVPGPGAWTPRDRRTALRFLAGLPQPAEAHAVRRLALAARSEQQWPGQAQGPVCWRDGYGLLQDGSRLLSPLVALRYLTLVGAYVAERDRSEAVDATLEELAAWVDDRLAEHPESALSALVTEARLPDELRPRPDGPPRAVVRYPSQGDGRPVVTVVLDPVIGVSPTRFFWQVWLDDGEGEPRMTAADPSVEGWPAEELTHLLGPPLARAFRSGDRERRPVPLEVALPAGEFDIGVHRWRFATVAALDDHAYLGAKRQVVVRDLARRAEPDEGAWADRWRGLGEGRPLEAYRVPERGRTPQAARYAKLPAASVPVLCRAAGRGLGLDTMAAVLDSGHPVALWHIEGHSARGCAAHCDDLHAQVAEYLRGIDALDELPDRIRHLRKEISDRHTGSRWAEPLALLYDDPERPLPGAGLGVVDAPL